MSGKVKNLSDFNIFLFAIIKDTTYNIPICLWIEETYPQTAPICYIRPTQQMMILSGKYISSNGEVMLPYLREWKNVRIEAIFVFDKAACGLGVDFTGTGTMWLHNSTARAHESDPFFLLLG